jgi:hypothetical protein
MARRGHRRRKFQAMDIREVTPAEYPNIDSSRAAGGERRGDEDAPQHLVDAPGLWRPVVRVFLIHFCQRGMQLHRGVRQRFGRHGHDEVDNREPSIKPQVIGFFSDAFRVGIAGHGRLRKNVVCRADGMRAAREGDD